MTAECTRTKLRFQGLDGRDVVGRLSECFTDHRDPDRIEHSVEALTKQRVLGLCLGYEDLNDHDELCRDRLLALLCDRDDLTGEFRRLESSHGRETALMRAGGTSNALGHRRISAFVTALESAGGLSNSYG